MKPVNLDRSPCTPVSSNCVVWQGPDIPCIKLCKGDTISDVIFKLATELCKVLDQLDVSQYDLACLGVQGCVPKDFQDLIELLIQKICDLENAPVNPPSSGGSGCPTDCQIEVNTECFGAPAIDSLYNYVSRIGDKACELSADFDILENTVDGLATSITILQGEVGSIPAYTLPDINLPAGCEIGAYTGPDAIQLDQLFQAFINEWCSNSGTIGSPSEISAVLEPTCTLSGSTYFNADIVDQPGWINPPANLADAISNIWTSICFFYDFKYKEAVVTGSGDISVTSSFNPVTNVTTYDVSTAFPLADLVPPGVVVPYAGIAAVAPAGWVFCNGALYDGTDPVYSNLYTAIGTQYGGGGTNFFVPNLENRIPVGIGTNASGYDLTTLGNTGGSRTETLIAAQIPTHTHGLASATASGVLNAPLNGTVTGTCSGTTSSEYAPLVTASSDGTGGSPGPPRTGEYLRLKVGADGNLDSADTQQQIAHDHTFSGTVTGTVAGTASGPFNATLSGNTDNGGPALQGLPHGNMQPYIVMRYIIKL